MTRGLSKIQLRHTLILLGLIALGAGLRLYNLGAKSLWGDEIWTAQRAQWSLPEIFVNMTKPPYMPFMYVLVHFSSQVERNEFWWRLPSALFGIAGIYIIYRLADATLERRTAYISTFLYALSPFLIWYTQDARYYAILTTLGLASVYAFYLAVTSPRNKIWYWLAFVIVTAILIYTHIFAYWILLAEGIFGFYVLIGDYRGNARKDGASRRDYRRRAGAFGASLIALFVIALPTIIRMMSVLRSGDSPTGEGLARLSLIPKAPYFFKIQYLGQYVENLSGGRTLTYVLIPLFFLGFVHIWVKARRAAVLFALILAVPFFTSLFLEFRHAFEVKYFVYLIPYFLIVVASGIVAISIAFAGLTRRGSGSAMRTQSIERAGLVLLTLLVVLLHVQPLSLLYRQNRVNDWRAIARYLEDQSEPGDVILTEKWGLAALSLYFQRGEDVKVQRADEETLERLGSLGPRVWFIGLNGPIEERLGASQTAVDEAAWQDSRFFYSGPKDADIQFPITEPPADIYLLQENPILAYYDFEDISDADWTDQSFRPILPGSSTVVRLAVESEGPNTLTLRYLHHPDRDIDVFVDGEKVDSIHPESYDGWQTWHIVIPGTTDSMINVSLHASGSDIAAVNWISLARAPAGE